MSTVDEYTLFDPEKARQEDKTRYPGRDVHVLYDRRRCMHAAECGRASKEAFNAKRAPWIDPDALEAAELVRVVQRCPTGAIRVVHPDGAEIVGPIPVINEVAVSPDGPLYLRGRIHLEGVDDAEEMETQVALCRCGASQNKPFCDGSHSRARFHDAGGVNDDVPLDAPPLDDGPLTVKLADNGPLLLRGPHVIRAASGRVACSGDKKAMCRCGNSGNKPFCDGSHNRVGWRGIDGDGR